MGAPLLLHIKQNERRPQLPVCAGWKREFDLGAELLLQQTTQQLTRAYLINYVEIEFSLTTLRECMCIFKYLTIIVIGAFCEMV